MVLKRFAVNLNLIRGKPGQTSGGLEGDLTPKFVARADHLQSVPEGRRSRAGKPLVKLRIALDPVIPTMGDTH